MNAKRLLLVAALALLALPAANAHAGGHFGVGVYIGGPYFYRPYYYPPYYYSPYYYRPAVGVYVAPPPPVIVQPAPVIQTVPVQPAPPVYPSTSTSPPAPAPALDPVQPASRVETRGDDIDHCMQHLSNPDDKVRADMAIRLGRLKARRAAEPLERMLASDRSAEVRDAAARALGLIGMPASLPALQRAAQGDDDRGVRNRAQFAVEGMRRR